MSIIFFGTLLCDASALKEKYIYSDSMEYLINFRVLPNVDEHRFMMNLSLSSPYMAAFYVGGAIVF